MSNLPEQAQHIEGYDQANYQPNKDDDTVYRSRGRVKLKDIDRLKNSRDLGTDDDWWEKES